MKKGISNIVNISVILSLALTLLMPFSVYADTVGGNSPIIGVNITISDYESYRVFDQLTVSLDSTSDRWKCVSFNSSGACNAYNSADTSNNYTNSQIIGTIDTTNVTYDVTHTIYEYEFILDNSYVGYVVFSNSFGNNSNKTYYINGSSFKVTSSSLTRSFTISSYSLNKNDLGIEWQFPIESFPWCSYLINSLWNRYYGLNSFNSYTFPIFNVQPGDIIYSGNTSYNWTWDLILYVNRSVNSSKIADYILCSQNATFKNWTMINRYNLNGTLGYLFKVQLEFDISGSSSSNTFTLTWSGGPNNANLDGLLMPIYFNPVYEKSYISTDFALNFGLTNQLLDDIHYIASNTPSGQQATDNLDDQTSDLASDSDNYISLENDLSSGFDDSMENMPTNFNFNTQFGTKFSQSAMWVRTQFNNLTVNNPFGSLITYSLILGLALLLVGRKLL